MVLLTLFEGCAECLPVNISSSSLPSISSVVMVAAPDGAEEACMNTACAWSSLLNLKAEQHVSD